MVPSMAWDKDDIKSGLENRRTAQVTGRIGGHGHDPSAGVVDVVTQADAVPEEHVYAYSRTPDGNSLLWEIDLIGDLSHDEGYGRLPVVLHMECPYCTSPKDRRAMTITQEGHGYEIEPIPPRIEQVSGVLGRREVVVDRLFSVRRPVTCPYCMVRFTVRGGLIEKCS